MWKIVTSTRDLETVDAVSLVAGTDKPHDAFRGQSRSSNIVPFHMLGILSSCAVETLSLRSAVFLIFDFKKCRDLEIRVRGHLRSLKVVPFDRLHMVSPLVFYRNIVPKIHRFSDIQLQKCRDLENCSGVHQSHRKCHRAIERI